MPNGKNTKINTTPISETEKEKIKLNYQIYYQQERAKKIKVVLMSLVATGILVWALVFAFMKLI